MSQSGAYKLNWEHHGKREERKVAITEQTTLRSEGACLKGSRTGVSAGPDGSTYEGLQYLLSRDTMDRIPTFPTQLLRAELPLPTSWKRGRIVLLPKVPRPCCPKDLRPICLTPVLGRIFSKVLMSRVHGAAPPPRRGTKLAAFLL